MVASSSKCSYLCTLFALSIFIVFVIGCSRQTQTTAQQSTASDDGNATSGASSELGVVPPTPEPTATASPTLMPTAIPTERPTDVPTMTPLPTMTVATPTRSAQRPVATIAPGSDAELITPMPTVSMMVSAEIISPTVTVTSTAAITSTDVATATVDATVEPTLEAVESTPEPTAIPVVAENSAVTQASAESIGQAGFTASVGNSDEMDMLFQQIRREVDQYAAAIDVLTVEDCAQLNAIYTRIVSSPQFQPPEYRRQAYISYITSINSMRGGGEKLTNFCSDYLAAAGSAEIPGDASTAVVVGTSKSEHFINQAITQLQVFPVTATLVESRRSNLAGFWEVDLTFSLDQGVPPYEARVGGFLRQDGNRITILHTCQRDFVDHVSVVDANGQFFRSNKVSASRLAHC